MSLGIGVSSFVRYRTGINFTLDRALQPSNSIAGFAFIIRKRSLCFFKLRKRIVPKNKVS